jgi:2-octaprenyl-6-methoxyphenol hydroxylase
MSRGVPERVDVLVAGGGVAGLTAAAAFASAGFATLCVDPVPPVTASGSEGSDTRSTAFLLPAVALLERAGLWDALSPNAAPLRVMRLVDAGGDAGRVRESVEFRAEEVGADLFGYNLPNWLLRREMVSRLGPTLRAPAAVVRVTTRIREAIVALASGDQVRARLVVAADGRDSFVRTEAGIGVRRWGYGQKALVFTVVHALPHGDASTEIHRSGGPFTLVPLPDGPEGHRSAVVWMEAGPTAAALAALGREDFDAALAERACGILGDIRLSGERRLWPIVAQLADRLDGPRTALVAEAAHVVPPIGAQGLNMSLQDIATLLDIAIAAREAGEDFGGPTVLARYHRARHAELAARVAGIDALNRAAMAGARPLRDLRGAALHVLAATPPLRRAAMRLGLAMRDRG